MSMITTGTSELGCIITGDNMQHFVRKYVEQNPGEFTELLDSYDPEKEADVKLAEDLVWEWLDTNEGFRYSISAENTEDVSFCARIMRDEPYYPNMYILPIAEALEYRSEVPDFIFVTADKGCFTRAVLRGDFYKSRDKLVQEFRDKLSGYLPEDFDWLANIGDLDYAIFA